MDRGQFLNFANYLQSTEYSIISEASLDKIVAIRLEPVRDRSLVDGSTGCCVGRGDFELTEFQLRVENPPGQSQKVAIEHAFHDGGFFRARDGKAAIDGGLDSAIQGAEDIAIFVPNQPIENPCVLRLTTVMEFGKDHHS